MVFKSFLNGFLNGLFGPLIVGSRTSTIISVLNQSNSIYLVESFLSVTRNLFLKSFTMRV